MIEKAWTGWEGSALHVRCDQCDTLFDSGAHSDDEARDLAADVDWTYTCGVDMCPTCTRDRMLEFLNAALRTVPTE